MIGSWTDALTLGAAIGAGTAGGALFAFSTFVMPALRRLPDREGLRAMQAINLAAPQPLFMLALFGTAVASVVLGAATLGRLDEDPAPYRLAGSIVYVAGTLVTVAFHIPRNDALARVDADGASAADAWRRFAGPWTTANHVRTATGLAAAVLFTLGLAA
jgi:uncharacterized membrane protein